MAQKVYAVVNQKGGVAKSATACSLALELAKAGKKVLLADFDPIQQTSIDWYDTRDHKLDNLVVRAFRGVKDLAQFSKGFDVIVVDGAAHASDVTFDISEIADKIFIPTGSSFADLKPSARLALELMRKGIDGKRIKMVLTKIATPAEALAGKYALEEQGLKVLGRVLKASPGYVLTMDAGKGLQESPYPTLRAHAQTFIDELIK